MLRSEEWGHFGTTWSEAAQDDQGERGGGVGQAQPPRGGGAGATVTWRLSILSTLGSEKAALLK